MAPTYPLRGYTPFYLSNYLNYCGLYKSQTCFLVIKASFTSVVISLGNQIVISNYKQFKCVNNPMMNSVKNILNLFMVMSMLNIYGCPILKI